MNLESDKVRLQSALESSEKRVCALDIQCKEQQTEIVELKHNLEDQKNQNQRLSQDHGHLREEHSSLETRCGIIEKQLNEYQIRIMDAKQDIATAHERTKEHKKHEDQLIAQIKEFNKAQKKNERIIEEGNKNIKELCEKLEEAQQTSQKLNDELNSQDETITQLQERVKEKDDKIRQVNNDLSDQQRQNKKVVEDLERMDNECQKLEADNKKQKNLNNSLSMQLMNLNLQQNSLNRTLTGTVPSRAFPSSSLAPSQINSYIPSQSQNGYPQPPFISQQSIGQSNSNDIQGYGALIHSTYHRSQSPSLLGVSVGVQDKVNSGINSGRGSSPYTSQQQQSSQQQQQQSQFKHNPLPEMPPMPDLSILRMKADIPSQTQSSIQNQSSLQPQGSSSSLNRTITSQAQNIYNPLSNTDQVSSFTSAPSATSQRSNSSLHTGQLQGISSTGYTTGLPLSDNYIKIQQQKQQKESANSDPTQEQENNLSSYTRTRPPSASRGAPKISSIYSFKSAGSDE
ncbi:MAG: hypothetical protein EZS28_012659 [Streblomastix strix]|uniref:t-SNARE coiled-coil homology domain-containing protein n=1 Tax=Streblomastix strix TaxID=222440 RepID=A0A5J4WAL1_9EUKA|nr:MAG: hypothetical protein EZS28_012659 [Streblomastix strix]